MADSVCCAVLFNIIRGKKDIRFNSKPSQTVNQFVAVKEINVPERRPTKKAEVKGKVEFIKARIGSNYSNLG